MDCLNDSEEALSEDDRIWREFCKDVDDQNKLEMHFVQITGWEPDAENK